MNTREYIKKNFGISDRVLDMTEKAESELLEQFKQIEETAALNQLKVMKAFRENRVSEAHLLPSTGYGYDDLGRDALDKVYASVFGAEDAIVRHNFVSGTHTISTAFFSVLRPGDTLLAMTGKPYDTLEEVIGITGDKGSGSLMDFGVNYIEASLKPDGKPDFQRIDSMLKEQKIKAVTIQRSKGYDDRASFSVKEIGEMTAFVKERSPETVCIVDNCYGEFAEEEEPTEYGADLIAGSLIKNPGGGLAKTGGYIAGKKKYIELCAYRLTSVGIGRECGASLGHNREMYQGLFFAPHIVSQAKKSAALCSHIFWQLGFKTDPMPYDKRRDIIQSIEFGNKDKLIAFCQGIQQGAPIDSFVTPQPWDMPGYHDQVIMAAGAFVQGASIELSADAPIKPPYIAYMQGGLTYESARLGIMAAAEKIINIIGNCETTFHN